MPEATCDIYGEDCIGGGYSRLADGSVHLTVTSIPFEELFTYSGKIEDVGNNGSTIDVRHGRFALNLRFVVAQLLRVHAAGTNCCVHIQQLLSHAVQHGFMGRRDFRGAVIDLFRAGGWQYTGEIAIPKCPQVIAKRTSLHSLQFKTGYARTSTMWAPAPCDFVLIFQKPGRPLVPVRPLIDRRNPTPGWMTKEDWILWARGVWEIDPLDVLDGAATKKYLDSLKEEPDEKHVCPLQLEVIRRLVMMYSNPAEIQPDVLVLDPFMGIGSTAFACLGGVSPHSKLSVPSPRNVTGFELKESYHKAAVNHARIAREMRQAKLEQSDLYGKLDAGGAA